MNKDKKLIILNYNGTVVDSFENTYNLTRFEFPDITRKEVRDFYDQNIFISLRKYGKIAVTETELNTYFKDIHNPAQDTLNIFPGMKEFFENTANHVNFAINSSGTKDVIVKALERFNIFQYFLSVLGKKEASDKRSKFEYILSEYKKTPKDVLYITDKVGDMKEAQNSGLGVVLVTWGYQKKEHLEPYAEGAYGIVDTPKELGRIVQKWLN